MADKYRRIEKTQEALPADEIRVKRGVGIGRYLKRAHELLSGTGPDGKGSDQVIIKGVSNAVESAVKLAELIKHRIKGLHQQNRISHITIVDEYEPLEEGLDHLRFTRIVTMLEIILSKSKLNTDDVGYQEPIDEKEVQEYSERQEGEGEDGDRRRQRRRGGRGGRGGRGRGGRGGRGRQDGDRPTEGGAPAEGGQPRGEGGDRPQRRRKRRGGAPVEGEGQQRQYYGGQGNRGPPRQRFDDNNQGQTPYTGGEEGGPKRGGRGPRRGGDGQGRGGYQGGQNRGGRGSRGGARGGQQQTQNQQY